MQNILICCLENVLDLPKNFLGTSSEQKLLKLLQRELNLILANRLGSRKDERIAGVAFVEPFTIENGLLTQTLKQRRDRISERDQLAIDHIYAR